MATPSRLVRGLSSSLLRAVASSSLRQVRDSARRQRRQLEPPAAVRADQELREEPNGPGGMGKAAKQTPGGYP
jgi:hypothetical protein